jgi:type IV secretory pathway component VirB8
MMDGGWPAKTLSPKMREAKFQELRSLTGDRFLLRRNALRVMAGLAGCGLFALAASAIGWITILPLKTVEYRLISVDQSTGIIGVPVSLTDAPTLFLEASDHQYIKRYIEVCSGFIRTMDVRNLHLCKLMSTPPQQGRVEADRSKPDSPVLRAAKDVELQIDIDAVRAHRRPDGINATRSYFVQFVAVETERGGGITRVPYSGTIDFQWHPELPMLPTDRDDNTGGFQVLSYSVSADAADRRMR